MAVESRTLAVEHFDERPDEVAGAPGQRLALPLTVAGVEVVSAVVLLMTSTPGLLRACWVVAVLVTTALLSRRATGVRARPTGRRLVLDECALSFQVGPAARPDTVVVLGGPFGVTLLANRARTRVSLVVTTSRASFYVGAVVSRSDHGPCRELLAAAFTVASDERALEAAAPDGVPFVVDGPTLVRLYEALVRRDERCGGRLFLSDARGEPVELDGPRLVAGPRAFDLSLGLEWHGLLFRETGVGGVAVYQGTHVRQGETEVVFVSLMPALSTPSAPGDTVVTAEPVLERAVVRDMGLLHVAVAEPPPSHLRVAVERVFMLPLRAALSAAPARASAPSSSGERSRPPGSLLVS